MKIDFKKQNKGGYTIIETMISVSVFLVVIISGMGALLNANLLHKKSQDLRSIMDNLSFIVEDMSKNLRTGLNYQCFTSGQTLSPATISSPVSCAFGWAIAFEGPSGNSATYTDQWVYYISNDGKIFKSTDGAQNFIQLTPSDVSISSVSGFAVLGGVPISSPGVDRQQPFISINLVGGIYEITITTGIILNNTEIYIIY